MYTCTFLYIHLYKMGRVVDIMSSDAVTLDVSDAACVVYTHVYICICINKYMYMYIHI